MRKKQDIQQKVFDIVDSGRNLTVNEVKEAITEESNLALCEYPYKFAEDKDGNTWCLTEVDVFFPDDDYIIVTNEIAKQVVKQDSVVCQTLEGIKIYRTV